MIFVYPLIGGAVFVIIWICISAVQKKTLVISREDLFLGDAPEGFISPEEIDYFQMIQKNGFWMDRKKADNDPYYKHPIVYCIGKWI